MSFDWNVSKLQSCNSPQGLSNDRFQAYIKNNEMTMVAKKNFKTLLHFSLNKQSCPWGKGGYVTLESNLNPFFLGEQSCPQEEGA